MGEARWLGQAKYQALLAVARDALERDRRTLVLNDISNDTRMRRSTLERVGAECAVVLPLTMGEEFVAAIVFARVAATDSTVLFTGETGTGKDLIASELFGHEKGAFTGALERRRGRFELASWGTIFLHEVGELPPQVQVALLRVLQERECERVGGNETLRTDARAVAVSNRNPRLSLPIYKEVRAIRSRE